MYFYSDIKYLLKYQKQKNILHNVMLRFLWSKNDKPKSFG